MNLMKSIDKNIFSMFVTKEVSKLNKFNVLKEEHLLKTYLILVTNEVFKLDKSINFNEEHS